MEDRTKRRGRSGGNAVIEVSLMMPWFVFLFMGVFDFGFYAYALISTENAARSAAMYLAASFSAAQDEVVNPAPPSVQGPCQLVLGELKRMPNVGATLTNCSALPVRVQTALLPQPDGSSSTRVTVSYQTVQLFPIPGLTGRLTAHRTVELRIFGE